MARERKPSALAADAVEQAEEALEAAQAAIQDGVDEAHAYIKRNWEERPLTVIGTALGIGLVLGLLLNGRR